MLLLQGVRRKQHLCWRRRLPTACFYLNAYMGIHQRDQWRAAAYLLINLVSGTSIVFANKLVLSILAFHYVRLSPLTQSTAPCATSSPMSVSWFSFLCVVGVRTHLPAQRGHHVRHVGLCCGEHVSTQAPESMAGTPRCLLAQ